MINMRHYFYALAILCSISVSSRAFGACPCTLWTPSTVPGTVDSGDSTSVEVGVRIRADVAGFITGVRFYKSAANTGTHIGSVWTNTGTLLASVTFTGESSSGWQEADFSAPLLISPNTTYVVSYSDPKGHYSIDSNYFTTASLDNPPLHAQQDGLDGPNGNYSLGHTFPLNGYQSSNYWVDVIFIPENTTSTPSILSVSPANNTTGINVGTSITVVFAQSMNASTINGTTFQLLDPSNHPVPGSVTYNAATQVATLITTLNPASTYTATVQGGSAGVLDSNGNPMPSNYTWSFTTAAALLGGYTLWTPSTTPVTIDGGDPTGVEVGVRIRADVAGFISGVRFYKSAANTGTHIGSLWTNTGTLLASVTFTNESGSGWQEADFSTPVLISPNTTYVVSYYDPNGHYSFDSNYFTAANFDNPPLHALQDALDGPDGNYSLGHSFPLNGYQSSNYWVDPRFIPENTTSTPTVLYTSPANNATGINIGANVTVIFAQSMNASTINATTFQIVDSSNNPVAGSVTYNAATQMATFTPTVALNLSTTYKANVQGGPTGVLSSSGNPMSSSYSWTFTTEPAPPSRGPGGPILVISSAVNPYTQYFSEILSTEGLNEYTVTDLSQVTSATLANYDVVILGDMLLSASQVSMLSNWVTGGGYLIAMHPDPQLAGLLGLAPLSSSLSDAYVLVQTTAGPGVGIVGQTMQFHGSAELYTSNGASAIATLYQNATTPTGSPAVSLNQVGSGQAAAFMYDLARSVVYTRQGNPSWSGEARDGQSGPIRSDDLFFGNASFDPQPDWVALSKVAIPQADEQQRLLANLILQMESAKKPLPRFWYFPSGFKAVVVMTGDDHGSFYSGSATSQRFTDYSAASTAGCSVADWQCVRATAYLFPQILASNPLTDSQVAAYTAQGFEISAHVDSSPTCSNWATSELDSQYTTILASLAAQFPSNPASQTHRMHCVSWSDYDSQPQIELKHGIRFDTSYYYWPPTWINDQPGLFTGSGMPMRFTDRNGNLIDVYQATTQMTDESGQSYPFNIDTVLGNAVGASGYYGAFVVQAHDDQGSYPGIAPDVVASAQANGVPIVSSLQMLTWLDGRNNSSFGSLAWSGSTLSFNVTQAIGARNLRAMLPLTGPTGALSSITLSGSPVSFTVQTIKGITYAVFNAASGSYQAVYGGSAIVALSSVSLSPSNVTGGTLSTGTVTLTGPAPTGGALVTLSSGNTSAATVPASVMVPTGSTSTIFTVATNPVVMAATSVITANYAASANVTLTVNPPMLSSVTLSPTFVTGGSNSTGTVTLNGVAPAGGAAVSLSSSNNTAAQVQSSVMVPAGSTTTTFTVTTSAVATITTVNITATYGGSASATLTVNPRVALSSVSLSPTSVVGGNNATGTVRLNVAAPTGGVSVTLTSSNAATATVPASVMVSGGSTSATFTVMTLGVSSSATSVITATLGVSANATLTVTASSLSSVSRSPSSVVGGNNATGTVTLNGAAPPTGAVVTLSSSNTSAAQVPASVSIAAGSRSAIFPITTTPVAVNTSVTISGTYGVTGTTTVTVNAPTLSSLTRSPTSVVGGNISMGTVTLNGAAPTGGATVTLQSNNTSAAQVPVGVTIAAGLRSATFTITTGGVASSTSVTITAMYGTTRTTTLTVSVAALTSLTLNPSTVTGGTPSTGTLTLNGAAPPSGATVSLTSSNTSAAQVPSSATIPAGATSVTFTVTTGALHGTSSTIGGTYRSTTRRATLTLQ